MKDCEDCPCERIGEDLDVRSSNVFGDDFTSVYGTCGQAIFDVVFILL